MVDQINKTLSRIYIYIYNYIITISYNVICMHIVVYTGTYVFTVSICLEMCPKSAGP